MNQASYGTGGSSTQQPSKDAYGASVTKEPFNKDTSGNKDTYAKKDTYGSSTAGTTPKNPPQSTATTPVSQPRESQSQAGRSPNGQDPRNGRNGPGAGVR